MTSELGTLAAELDSVDTSDNHFLNQRQVRKVAGDGEGEKDEFDGWDSNWYWDNDFDCLSVSGDSPTEMISVVICSDDEMGSIAYRDDSVQDANCVALPSKEEAPGTSRDLSNEEYLMHFEQKFSQATEFGYNISSVSSSLNSSSDSSLHLVTQAEVNPEFWLKQEKRRLGDAEHQQLTTQPSSHAAAAADHRVGAYDSSGCGKEDMDDCAFAAQYCQHEIPNELLHGIVQTAKDKKEKKRKVRKKTSKVSSSSKTEKCPYSQSQNIDQTASVQLRIRTESSFHPGYSNNGFIGNKVLAVFGFSAVLGIFSGLVLGFLTSQLFSASMTVGDERMLEFTCPRSVYQSSHQMIVNSVWASKYEELVIENAELHLKLQHLNQKFLFDLFQAQHTVANMRREVGEIREDVGELQRSSESECRFHATVNMLPPHDSFNELSSLAIPQSESVCRVLVPQSENLCNDLYQICPAEALH